MAIVVKSNFKSVAFTFGAVGTAKNVMPLTCSVTAADEANIVIGL